MIRHHRFGSRSDPESTNSLRFALVTTTASGSISGPLRRLTFSLNTNP